MTDPITIESLMDRFGRLELDAARITSPSLCRQLRQLVDQPVDSIICSVVDTDPSVPLQVETAAEFTQELSDGIALLAKLTDAARVWVAADPAKAVDWFARMRPPLRSQRFKLIPVRSDYPQSDPTLMLYTLLDRRLKPGVLPTNKRVLLLDAAAVVLLQRVVSMGESIPRTPFALRDHFSRTTHLLDLPVGMPLSTICSAIGIELQGHRFRAGEFLRDLWIEDDPAMGSGELLVHVTARHLDANPDPCIRCGWCVEACPTRVHPAALLEICQSAPPQLATQFGIDACLECGICSYVCPTRLPLLAAIRSLRQQRASLPK